MQKGTSCRFGADKSCNGENKGDTLNGKDKGGGKRARAP